MTDLEITRLCAEAMGYKFFHSKHGYWTIDSPEGEHFVCCKGWLPFDPYTGEKLREPTADDAISECGYSPLWNDEQAMALVKELRLRIEVGSLSKERWLVSDGRSTIAEMARTLSDSLDLNRAICECVAKMQSAKQPA